MSKFRFNLYSIIILVVASLLHPCFAQTDNINKIPDITVQMNSEVFPLHEIAESDRVESVYRSADLNIDNQGSVLKIQGRDLPENSWEAEIPINGSGCAIFLGDLDENGKSDLIVWEPGIGSRGSYDNQLIILLFDATGKPIPWSATGEFNATTNGISEIRRGAGGAAVILHKFITGHPAWGGVTYISRLYKVADAEITSLDGKYSRIDFPAVTGARAADPLFQKAMSRTSLSTVDGNLNISRDSQIALPHFIRYGADASIAAKAQAAATVTAEQGARLTVDMDALNAAAKHIVMSDGSKLELPTILIIDSSSGKRKIVFSPDGDDLTPLERGSFSMKQIGMDCQDADQCQPFILNMVEQKP